MSRHAASQKQNLNVTSLLIGLKNLKKTNQKIYFYQLFKLIAHSPVCCTIETCKQELPFIAFAFISRVHRDRSPPPVGYCRQQSRHTQRGGLPRQPSIVSSVPPSASWTYTSTPSPEKRFNFYPEIITASPGIWRGLWGDLTSKLGTPFRNGKLVATAFELLGRLFKDIVWPLCWEPQVFLYLYSDKSLDIEMTSHTACHRSD